MPDWLVRTPRPIASVFCVDPDAIAAFDLARRLDAAEHRDAEPLVGGLVQRRLGAAQRLAHGKDDRAVRRSSATGRG